MSKADRERWEKARLEVIDRWRTIIERVEARDEGGVLRLSNVMDEFCDEAATTRERPERDAAGGGEAELKTDSGTLESRCRFCRGFAEGGGCLTLLDDFNRAVLGRHWGRAKQLAEEYIASLQAMDLSRPARPAVH